MLGWSLTRSILFAAVVVLLYVFWGGLSSSIYNEVIQFFLIWLGLLPIVFLGLKQVGGFAGLAAKLQEPLLHAIKYLGTSNNPLGVDWFGVVMGLGFVLSFGYWTTDFLVVQRALASKNLNSARMTPIIAAFPKMLVPIIVVIPGLVALLVLPEFSQAALPTADYNSALILLMKHYLPNGLLGLAITALLASFMSGMAGNVTAFNTIWTYDIYGTYIKKGQPDAHYLKVGKYATVIGDRSHQRRHGLHRPVGFPNLMDYMQLIFSFFNAPLFATFLLGMFWKGATAWGGFWGLLVRHPDRGRPLHPLQGRRPDLPQRHGRQLLPGHLGLAGRLRRHDRGQPLHGQAGSEGARRPRLRPDAEAQGRCPLVRPAGGLGDPGHHHRHRPQRHLLVIGTGTLRSEP